jgi:DNA-3-methyladenine glycosylase I
MTTYCDVAPSHEWHRPYHNKEYGFPLEDDAALFERLMLEINQAGLSWLTILKKRERILELRKSHGSFAGWLAAHHPRSKEEWVTLFKKTFRFTGGEIVGEKRRPPWSDKKSVSGK